MPSSWTDEVSFSSSFSKDILDILLVSSLSLPLKILLLSSFHVFGYLPLLNC